MSLKHLNIAVPDVAPTVAFLETYFDFHCLEIKGDNVIAILANKDDFIVSVSHFTKNEVIHYPADFHIGFVQESPEQVIAIYERLKADGIDVGKEPRTYGGRGTMSFYVPAPGGFLIEVLCML